MRGTPASRGQSFIARDHRYVYLGGSVIALVGLSLWYSAPSPYSFLPAGSVPGTALAAVCYLEQLRRNHSQAPDPRAAEPLSLLSGRRGCRAARA